MAETAKILNLDKTVLLPAKEAGCSLAESITAQDVRNLRAQFPGVPVVTYVNTYADVKAESDICCTSSNAAAIVASIKSDTVICIPDEYLSRNVARETGKHIIFPTRDMPAGGGDGGDAAGDERRPHRRRRRPDEVGRADDEDADAVDDARVEQRGHRGRCLHHLNEPAMQG